MLTELEFYVKLQAEIRFIYIFIIMIGKWETEVT